MHARPSSISIYFACTFLNNTTAILAAVPEDAHAPSSPATKGCYSTSAPSSENALDTSDTESEISVELDDSVTSPAESETEETVVMRWHPMDFELEDLEFS